MSDLNILELLDPQEGAKEFIRLNGDAAADCIERILAKPSLVKPWREYYAEVLKQVDRLRPHPQGDRQ